MLEEENKDNYTLTGKQERKTNDAKVEVQMLLQSPEEKVKCHKLKILGNGREG